MTKGSAQSHALAFGSSDPQRTDEGIILYEGMPHSQKVLYGNVTWDGALSLAKLFAWMDGSAAESKGNISGKACLELGAGTGAVGLTLASLGAEVLLTDNEEEVVQLLHRNIAANGLQTCAAARLLDWAHSATYTAHCASSGRPFDIVAAADVLYEGEGTLFAKALQAHVPEGSATVAYVSNHHNPTRCNATLGFLRSMFDAGFAIERLEDSLGQCVGSLCGVGSAAPAVADIFGTARFVALQPGQNGLNAVRDARFNCREVSPMRCIQIFRLRRQRRCAL